MVMFLLSFVKGSKSAEGGPNPLADMDPGGPILGGSKSARTAAPFQNIARSRIPTATQASYFRYFTSRICGALEPRCGALEPWGAQTVILLLFTFRPF